MYYILLILSVYTGKNPAVEFIMFLEHYRILYYNILKGTAQKTVPQDILLINFLFYSYALRQVSWLIYIQTFGYADIVSQ